MCILRLAPRAAAALSVNAAATHCSSTLHWQPSRRRTEQRATEVRACLLCMQGGGAEEPSNLAGELEPVSILISSKRLNKLDLTGASANKWQVLNQTEK